MMRCERTWRSRRVWRVKRGLIRLYKWVRAHTIPMRDNGVCLLLVRACAYVCAYVRVSPCATVAGLIGSAQRSCRWPACTHTHCAASVGLLVVSIPVAGCQPYLHAATILCPCVCVCVCVLCSINRFSRLCAAAGLSTSNLLPGHGISAPLSIHMRASSEHEGTFQRYSNRMVWITE